MMPPMALIKVWAAEVLVVITPRLLAKEEPKVVAIVMPAPVNRLYEGAGLIRLHDVAELANTYRHCGEGGRRRR